MRKHDERLRERIEEMSAVVHVGFPMLMSLFPWRNVIAITFGRHIWLHPDVMESVPEKLDSIVGHELTHVAQYRRDGMVPFLTRYLYEYVLGRLKGMSHYQAYSSISYEREARNEG